MSRVKFILLSERGFLLLNVIFLTLITSFAAMILLNAVPRVRNPQPTLKLTAMYLANEQFAELESLAAAGEQISSCSFLGPEEDLQMENAGEGRPITFTVDTSVDGSETLRDVTVTVKWEVGGKKFELEAERTIFVAQQNSQEETS